MPAINEDVRADIREALTEVIVLVETVRLGLETALEKSSEKDVRITISALSRYVRDTEAALQEMDELVERLLASGIGIAATRDEARFAEVIAFYADAANHEQIRGRQSKVARDAGAKARQLQEILTGEAAGAAE